MRGTRNRSSSAFLTTPEMKVRAEQAARERGPLHGQADWSADASPEEIAERLVVRVASLDAIIASSPTRPTQFPSRFARFLRNEGTRLVMLLPKLLPRGFLEFKVDPGNWALGSSDSPHRHLSVLRESSWGTR